MSRSDTHPDAWREQLRLLRSVEPQERVAIASALTQQTRRLSMMGFAPGRAYATAADRRQAWARLVYGDAVLEALDPGGGPR